MGPEEVCILLMVLTKIRVYSKVGDKKNDIFKDERQGKDRYGICEEDQLFIFNKEFLIMN